MRFASVSILLVLALASGCRTGASTRATESVDVLLIAPLDVELAAAKAALASGEAREIAGREAFVGAAPSGARVAVIRSGWGKAHASGAVAAGIAAFAPRRIVLAGIGGGLDAETGDVVIGLDSYQHDLGKVDAGRFELWAPEDPREKPYPGRFKADESLVKELQHAASGITWDRWEVSECSCQRAPTTQPCSNEKRPVGRERGEVRSGTIATGDVFVVDPAVVERLRSEQAIAVDMEAAGVAQEARNHGIPFATVRVIADVAGRPESESLYYCVKPQAAARLESVLRAWLR